MTCGTIADLLLVFGFGLGLGLLFGCVCGFAFGSFRQL